MTKSLVKDIKSLPDGSMAVLGSFPDIVVFSSSNNVIWYHSAGNNDYSSNDKSHFRINGTGSYIGFTPTNEPAYSFDVSQGKLLEEKSLYPAPVNVNAGTTILDLENDDRSINGKKILFSGRYESFNTTDISNNGKQIVFGTGWNLYLADNNAEMKWQTPVPCAVWARQY
ncbi:MAG: hypothetical protein IPP73_09975 [Chitinophagaceae bacterium]|nr:hypothetical protein [Chitinophagaceae bacterium]